MGREDMVRLAKESGVWDEVGFPQCVINLIELVAAHEREACAKVCDFRARSYSNETDMWAYEHVSEAKLCAAAIRARGEVVEVA